MLCAVLSALAAHAAPVQADEKLARSKACLACHAIDKKQVGPAFGDIALRYRGSNAAEELLVTKIRQGGAGAWGQVPMAPNPQVSDSEARTLVRWILAIQKK
ncbi:MAG: c-type cytochrome [Burkholderiales bacterium]|nr:c-type cytochrome [Burkholderiales bacterium]